MNEQAVERFKQAKFSLEVASGITILDLHTEKKRLQTSIKAEAALFYSFRNTRQLHTKLSHNKTIGKAVKLLTAVMDETATAREVREEAETQRKLKWLRLTLEKELYTELQGKHGPMTNQTRICKEIERIEQQLGLSERSWDAIRINLSRYGWKTRSASHE